MVPPKVRQAREAVAKAAEGKKGGQKSLDLMLPKALKAPKLFTPEGILKSVTRLIVCGQHVSPNSMLVIRNLLRLNATNYRLFFSRKIYTLGTVWSLCVRKPPARISPLEAPYVRALIMIFLSFLGLSRPTSRLRSATSPSDGTYGLRRTHPTRTSAS